MHRGRFIFAAALMLAAAHVRAATTTPIVIADTDFTLQDPTKAPFDWQTNGNAGLQLDPTGTTPITLALAHNVNSEASAAWNLVQGTVPSFTMTADVNITFDGKIPAACPADGFAMAFANTAPNSLGGGGTPLGLYSSGKTIPNFINFEVNLWHGNALLDTADCTKNEFTTFEFGDVDKTTGFDRNIAKPGTPATGGAFLGQVTAPATLTIVNGGWYRYQWNVDAVNGTMAAYITGLDATNNTIKNMPLTNVTLSGTAPKINFSGRWGLTAGTGGAHAGVEVAHAKIVSPMVAPQ
jgi:hypothetical protein